jgi:hypothetical protein
MSSAEDEDLVANHVDLEKKEKIVLVRSWYLMSPSLHFSSFARIFA